jgi:hypothetical protein
MRNTDRRRFECQQAADLAREVLGQLFAVHAGEPARAVRVYRDSDAVLLLLRFDPRLAGAGADADLEARMEGALVAMCEMVTEAVSRRSGSRVIAGNVSVCAPIGLAVFAMRVGGEHGRGASQRPAGGRARGIRGGEGPRLASRPF